MKNLGYYRTIQNSLTSNSKKETLLNNAKQMLDNDFYNSVDYDTVFFDYRLNNNEQDLTITNTNILDEFTINSKTDETFELGEVLSWQKNHWLVTKISNDKRLKTKGKIKRCNYKLRWQNTKGDIIERWIVSQDASSYSTGIESNKQISLGSDQLMIYIPSDKETISVLRDKRFMIDLNTVSPTCYKLTRVDTTTYTINGIGYCAWIVSEDPYNPQTDNIEEMICDYISPVTSTKSNIEITYNGQAQIRVGGSAKTFTANTDNEITIWSKVCTTSQEDYIVLATDITDGNKCKVKCMGDTSLIGSEFKLQCTDGTNNGELLISIVGGV